LIAPSGGDGPIKTEALRGVKDTPTYFHDGRLMTLDDTVEFFNLILGTKLTPQEKKDLVAFMLTLWKSERGMSSVLSGLAAPSRKGLESILQHLKQSSGNWLLRRMIDDWESHRTHGDWAVAIARIVLGIVFFAHGAQKMLGWYGGPGLASSMRTFTEHLHLPADDRVSSAGTVRRPDQGSLTPGDRNNGTEVPGMSRPHVIGGERHRIGTEVDRRWEEGDDLDAMRQTPIEYRRRASRAREPLVQPSLSLTGWSGTLVFGN
jgi:hypothetical protein